MQGDRLEPFVDHPFNDLPNWLEEADATIIASALWDKDCDDPAQLGWDLALAPDGLEELYQRLPCRSGAYICRSRLWVLFQLCSVEPLFQVLCTHLRHSRTATVGQFCYRCSNLPLIGGVVSNFGTHRGMVEDDGEAR